MPRPVRAALLLVDPLIAGARTRLILSSLLACIAAFPANAAVPASSVQPTLIVHKLDIDIAVDANGRAVATTHREQSATNRAAAALIAQFPIAFNPSLERLEILEAHTSKRDGSRIPADLGAVRSRLAAGVANAPIFQDVQQKTVVFPDLGADDVSVITYRQSFDRPFFAGQFFWQYAFDRTTAWDEVSITITAPKSLPLRTESFGVGFARREQDGMVSYRWRYHAMNVIAEDLAGVSSWDRLPRLFVSSFPDYAALATAYAQRAHSLALVTPLLQARADAITQGISDRRAQARALYEWVSGHVRYVALPLAAGGVEPHAADSVLLHGYGDCKDHAVLFTALLKAKGIEALPVLINLGTAYTLSGPPTLAQLDHVISYLPEFDLFADTTSGVAPFGTLPFQEYGKPVVMAGGPKRDDDASEAGAAQRVALLTTDAVEITTRTEAHIDLDGAIIGTSTTEALGPAAIALRLVARWVQMTGHESAARRQLLALGQMGTGTFSFAAPDGFANRFNVAGRFRLDPQPEILEGDSFAPPLGLQLLVRPGDYLLGPLQRPALSPDEATPCFPGRQIEELSLELPEGRKPLLLPADHVIERAAFRYSSRWSMEGQVVRVVRELVSRVDQPLCTGTLRRDVAAAMDDIRRDQRARIVLATP